MKTLGPVEAFEALVKGEQIISEQGVAYKLQEGEVWVKDTNDEHDDWVESDAWMTVFIVLNFTLYEPPKEPELYWQWREKNSGDCWHKLRTENEWFTYMGSYSSPDNYQRHAGPWIKTEEGFRKHEGWEQL